MTNTTTRPMTLESVSLQTHRWNLSSLTGLFGSPPKRGENVQTPFRHGAFAFGRKFYEERRMMMNISILPNAADGTPGTEHPDGIFGQLYENLDEFFRLLYSTDLLSLKRTIADGSTQRELLVEIFSDVNVTSRNRDQRYDLVIPLVAPRPFWRELPLITHTETSMTGSNAFTIDTGGNAPIDDVVFTIDCTADGSNPSISVPVTGEEITIADGSILNGDTIVIDLENREFTKNGVRYDTAIGRERAWFIELPSNVTGLGLVFDSDSGTFDLDIDWYDKWF